MSDNEALVTGLWTGVDVEPRVRDTVNVLIADLYELKRKIDPPVVVSQSLNPTPQVSVAVPTNFVINVFLNNIRLSWTAPGNGTFLYEIRLGATYDSATILLTTATLSADIDPVSRHILTGTSYTFWITTIDDLGNHSAPVSATVAIPNIGAPMLSASVIGNNVLLSWTIPFSTFTIAYYTVYRNGIFVGNINGTFLIIAEPVAGTFSYDVEAWDIVDNAGPLSGITNIIVKNPPDFQRFASVLSTFSGTKVNTYKDNLGNLFALVNVTETWDDHFNTRSWASIQAQITAGYPLYYEPGPGSHTGTYEEVIDFGSILNNIGIGVSYNVTNISGVVTIAVEIATSTDGSTYTGYISGADQFILTLRYAKVRLTFTGSNVSAIVVSSLLISLNIKIESEEGRVSALSTDATGTLITFTKAFTLIKALILVPESTTSCFAVYDSLSIASARVFVFDSAGIRVSKTVSWLVRGLV